MMTTRHVAAALSLLTFLLGGCAGTKGGAVAPTAAQDELAPPVRQVLPNGLRLIVQDHRAAEIVALYLWVGVGVRFEKPDELGYSHFMEHMLFKGTDKWGPGYLDRAVEGVGGRSNAVTSFDYTTFYLILPTSSLETGIQLLADMAFRSIFAPDEIGREREVIFEEARIETDTAKTAIIRQLYALVFDGNPYGRPVLGTPSTMNAANQDRLLAYYKHYYVPDNMALVVVGPVQPPAVRAMVDRVFGRMPSAGLKSAGAPAPAPLAQVVSRTVERPEQQAGLAMGWQAPRSDDSNGDAVDLLTTILAGTESSRLAKRLRDDEQLVSNVTMSYSALMGGGIVTLRAELEAKDVEKAERSILEEITKIQERGPTEEERQLAVTKFEAQHAFDTETSEGLAYAYGIAEMTWTLDAELGYVDRLRQVTREQIRDAARRYLTSSHYARLVFVPRKAR
jgi:zinc protease